jgi:hypothetical protein
MYTQVMQEIMVESDDKEDAMDEEYLKSQQDL